MVRLAKRDFERKIAKNIKKDSKTFFKYAPSKTKVKSTVGPLLHTEFEYSRCGQTIDLYSKIKLNTASHRISPHTSFRSPPTILILLKVSLRLLYFTVVSFYLPRVSL